jgi:succinate-semialdehyde dehydrogenase/glutarate-semialdehyde dehydrogenase
MTFSLSKGELIRQNNFIGGLWVPATNGAQFAVTNPATGEVIANVANSGPADARAATNAAARAFPMWRDALPKECCIGGMR